MDFITSLLLSTYKNRVYNSILVVVNRYTKVAIYLPIIKTINAAGLTDLTYRYIFLKYSWPEGIVSNKGSIFISSYWSAVYAYTKVKRRLNTAFYLQTNRQTERQNSILK